MFNYTYQNEGQIIGQSITSKHIASPTKVRDMTVVVFFSFHTKARQLLLGLDVLIYFLIPRRRVNAITILVLPLFIRSFFLFSSFLSFHSIDFFLSFLSFFPGPLSFTCLLHSFPPVRVPFSLLSFFYPFFHFLFLLLFIPIPFFLLSFPFLSFPFLSFPFLPFSPVPFTFTL